MHGTIRLQLWVPHIAVSYTHLIAERNNIKVKLDVTIPEVLTISSLSLSIIIGNTFDNAIRCV